MNRIDDLFGQLRREGRAAFIPFFTAGDPDLGTSARLLGALAAAGADLVELGFPYSDPLADGPTIQNSYHRALAKGLRLADVFDMVARARSACDLPIVAMISYSLVYRMGAASFLDRALGAGLDGATVPDLPIEESRDLLRQARDRDFHLVCFATPATKGRRREMVARHAAGFIYYISVRGITGERATLPEDLQANISELRSMTDVPVAVGFGISTPEHAAAAARIADGVIVGSAIVRRMAPAGADGGDPAESALRFVQVMSGAVRSAR
jgi:tryptophan synthase alpha chain